MMSREASRAPKLWYRTPVGPWSMCRHGQEDGGLYTVPGSGSDTLYFLAVDWHQAGGWQGLVGWKDGCMDGSGWRCPGALVSRL